MGAIPEYDPDEPVETKPFKFVTGELSLRPLEPKSDVTKHCWQNYVDYHKCVNAKGEDFRPCRQFFHAFRSLCPKPWTDRWDGQRGTYTHFPVLNLR
ncbi:cytochrome c oxidase subunit 6B [Aspergillus ellipticus CBS 707.79]|uniref:Cytochrome c oxidase subunit 6B n=1 Tax=Aspergillus ellipticus CBS 707.79 TaxID=1448320 RepID=A0A319DPV3_9EURO|nr:cytochrome c oxidase subunit 6B [Aspergillus ellipticus CBS 707.79]